MHTTLLLFLLSGASEPAAPAPAKAAAPVPAAAPEPSEEPAPATAPSLPDTPATSPDPAAPHEAVRIAAPAPPQRRTPASTSHPRTGHAYGFNGGAYLTVSGMTSVSLEGGQPVRIGGSFRTAGGYLWALRNQLKLYVGGGFHHRALMQSGQRGQSHETGVLTMARFGRGTDALWGYGLLGVGAELRFDSPRGQGAAFVDTYPVVSVEAGGGIAARLWRGFFVGGELTFETGTDFYSRGFNDSLSFFNARVVTGWTF